MHKEKHDHELENVEVNQAESQEAQKQEESAAVNLLEEVEKYKDQWMRTAAELENVRKRALKEREDALKYGITKFAQDMLSFADNITRALESCPATIPQEFEGLISGIKLIQGEVKTIFDRHAIKEIDPMGAPFDPNFHQAMFEIPAAEGQTPGNVAQVIQVGYMLHDRLLRPALVGVVKGS